MNEGICDAADMGVCVEFDGPTHFVTELASGDVCVCVCRVCVCVSVCVCVFCCVECMCVCVCVCLCIYVIHIEVVLVNMEENKCVTTVMLIVILPLP